MWPASCNLDRTHLALIQYGGIPIGMTTHAGVRAAVDVVHAALSITVHQCSTVIPCCCILVLHAPSAPGAVRELKSSVEEFQAALVEVPGGTTATDTTRAGVGSAVADASVPAQDGSGTEAFGASEDAAGSVVDSVTEQLQQQQAAREHGDRDEGTAAESSGRVAQPEAAPTAGDGGAAQAAMNAAAATTLVKGYLSRLERGMESVGRSALVYLEEVVGASVVGGGAGAGAASDGDAALALEGTAVGMVGASAATAAANDATEGEARGAGSAPAASSAGKSVMAELAPPCSFEEFLSLYGGRTAADDLLALSRACMETCERARPALGPEGQVRWHACKCTLCSELLHCIKHLRKLVHHLTRAAEDLKQYGCYDWPGHRLLWTSSLRSCNPSLRRL